MSKCVIDSSALLALLNQEPGSEQLPPALMQGAIMSSVNAAEVQAKLVAAGGDPDQSWQIVVGLVPILATFEEEHAKAAGTLVKQAKALGLSLGDRACLALGLALRLPIYTTDRIWTKAKLGVRIHLLR
ncbi:PilT protein-like protein [Candidatus Koribacter versatilis Ellin345]|uniref:PilT protein-like protein n=1 Tax=Koribacter versatilis (strain Ellin345) TaxID=204669 RepID=Q1IHH8_KORVE|nr:type II toxin-antitoxin system VapC family toxin [Candidatus Koribacter versatilis]ABF43672.1 PilT protein-like protein [Candidatus Koribacter versatilis Ellin345]